MRCRQLRKSLANTTIYTTSTATFPSEAASGAAFKNTPFDGGLGHSVSGEGDHATAQDAPVLPPAANDQEASMIDDTPRHSRGNDPRQGLGTGNVSDSAMSSLGKARQVNSMAAIKYGAREASAGATKQKSVRFKEGTVGGDEPSISSLRPLDGTTGASLMANGSPQDRSLWKHGRQRRTWKGLPSPGMLSYGSIDSGSDEERDVGGWDEEKGREPSAVGMSIKPRRSLVSDERRGAGEFESTSGGGAQSDAMSTQHYEDQGSPRGKSGWRGRVSKWYHDF